MPLFLESIPNKPPVNPLCGQEFHFEKQDERPAVALDQSLELLVEACRVRVSPVIGSASRKVLAKPSTSLA
ncbi:MAG: hypothetical protein JOY67_05795 [Hyphomicrobiales bacterium]|nr:hypothetical protein [Hyphomicrobiales bacterium]